MSSKHLWATKLTDNSSTAKEELGAVRREWDTTDSCFKVFKYVQASGTVADGTVLAFYDVKGTVATNDVSTTSANIPAGVGIGAITSTYYGWIQIGGYHDAVLTDGGDDIADGATIIVDPSTDGVCDSVAAGTASTYKPLGIAVAADVDASDTVAAIICCGWSDIVQ